MEEQTKRKINNQSGAAMLISVIFFLFISLAIIGGLVSPSVREYKNASVNLNSKKSYFLAESGTEDAFYRLLNNLAISGSEVITLDSNSATTTITTLPGGSKQISALGDVSSYQRKTDLTLLIGEGVSFNYGIQVGAGGLTMGSNSEIQGNAFVAGNITGSGDITGDVVVAENNHSISGVDVVGNVLAYSCLSGTVVNGNLTYVTGGSHTCSVSGSVSSQSTPISSEGFAITQTQIDDWKAETANGVAKSAYTINSNSTVTESSSVVITGNMGVGSGATWNLMGTTKIIGNLTINSNSNVNISDTLYVTGNISFGGGSITQLSSSYGSSSGVVLSDGVMTINSNTTLLGSGQTGSYILILSTSNSNSAINIGSNATGAIFYASAGRVMVNSNANVKEVTGYAVSLGSNAILQYESGLANLNFSGGPSGGWSISSWKEIE
ncbi:hypothetical protein A2641_00255 [Candidatus Nomurabacteria bacterium RIFCSPHIGHO2_01_FULL_37_25]|uniref:Type 4 fimbrial biogenesis protein PilX N-terminal domain-containing protein n=1 Tax=Candidatus Nomurabacteria bacterium RIFCSPLOWO2_01_FULL_36_16 TaxID=1801767 RepID=A0A1F6WYV4_9BACT|nr:MAG: hypothetical protein A2641_00255 [Candidatus Nomurabacteria bacterium RIFCSPHIGHO2_01_FULL_37_25]OGI75278.1 MAG: hypothetical protein A3D36_04035 [Candidatus Nomurabacteria bacterium RIFCSPHIGHO2_02_FULL_36_29]OGI86905.1 MAG: hypothetical protein A3A91_03495 [Candidatus Nomurabacteria bacterium RIFCSPLOWO2_01_FULL_36_16]